MSNKTIKPIQTHYKGYHFRSRLEARWAVFFDALGLKWEYEPEGFDLGEGDFYLPDFKVKYPGRDASEVHHEWFEVKGDLTEVTHAEWRKLLKFQEAEGLIVLDGTPTLRMYNQPGDLLAGNDSESYEPVEIKQPYRVHRDSLKHKRSGNALWCGKGRLWLDAHDNFFGYEDGGHDNAIDLLTIAVNAAKSARFEHGQKGATA